MAQDDSAAAAQVAVTNVIIDPAIFFEDDTGIINVEITNNGAQSVAIRRATIYGGEVTVLSQSYDTTTVIGAGNRMTFSFTIKADVPPGIYYPYFSLDFRDAGYLRYPIPIRVDNQPLTLAVLNKPDVFSEGRKDRVDILVGNPRDNPVSGVVVNFLGNRMDPVPSSYFIGNLDPDQSRQVSVNITPEEPGNLQILVEQGGHNRLGCGNDAGASNCSPAVVDLELDMLDFSLNQDGKPLMSPADMLRTATLQSARSMGIEDQYGSISSGKTADLAVIDGDPFEDFHLIGKPVQALFMDGKLVINRCGLQVTCPNPRIVTR
jgi:hypothetical protein